MLKKLKIKSTQIILMIIYKIRHNLLILKLWIIHKNKIIYKIINMRIIKKIKMKINKIKYNKIIKKINQSSIQNINNKKIKIKVL